MALQDIIQKIRSDGAADVQAIEDTRDAELATIASLRDEAMAKRNKVAGFDTARRATKVAERLLSKARHQIQLIAGSAERAKLEAVFGAIKDELTTLDGRSYETFLDKQLNGLPATSGGRFLVAKATAQVTKTFLASKGVPLDAIETETENNLLGGFVFMTDKQEFDCSFQGLLRNIRDHQAVEIAHKLTN